MRFLSLIFFCSGPLLVGGCVTERRVDTQAVQRATLASSQERWGEAQELWSQVLASSRGMDANARLALGEAFQRDGASRAALQVLRGGPPPEGRELEYGLVLGRACLDQGQVRAAGEIFTDILTQHPDHRETLVLYGEALLGGAREFKGVGLLLRALRIDPGDGSLAENVASRAQAQGWRAEAAEAWRLRLEAPNPPAEAYFGAAQTPDPANLPVEEWLQSALELDPQLGPAWGQLGRIRMALADTNGAIKAWRQAVQVDPGDTESCARLARTYIEQGQLSEARPWVDHALEVLKEPEERAPFEELARQCEL